MPRPARLAAALFAATALVAVAAAPAAALTNAPAGAVTLSSLGKLTIATAGGLLDTRCDAALSGATTTSPIPNAAGGVFGTITTAAFSGCSPFAAAFTGGSGYGIELTGPVDLATLRIPFRLTSVGITLTGFLLTCQYTGAIGAQAPIWIPSSLHFSFALASLTGGTLTRTGGSASCPASIAVTGGLGMSPTQTMLL